MPESDSSKKAKQEACYKASRLKVDLQTADGRYDEIVAFTERIINKNFENLFDLYPAMSKVKKQSVSRGDISLTLLPPRILIPDDTTTWGVDKVFYQLRIESGKIFGPGNSSEQDLSGWELAVPVQISLDTEIDKQGVVVDLHPETKDEDGKVLPSGVQYKQIRTGGMVYNYPGDYSVERLFAQIATATWGQPAAAYSRIIDPKTKTETSIDEWKTAKGNDGMFANLQSRITDWCVSNQKEGRSTLNMTFKMPKYLVNTTEPTYAPTFIHQQTYPHVNREDVKIDPTTGIASLPTLEELPKLNKRTKIIKVGGKDVEIPQYSLGGKGLNCLLYCEMVCGNTPPPIRDLKYSGNLVLEGSGVNDDSIDGTFGLGYTFFLEKHLLPRLQPLNKAVDIAGLKIKHSTDELGEGYNTNWSYNVGGDPDRLSSDDKAYIFQRQAPDANGVASYLFQKINRDYTPRGPGDSTSPDPQMYKYDDGLRYHWHDHMSDVKVSVTWTPGSNAFTVTGKTIYLYEGKYSSTLNPFVQISQLYYKFYFDWSFPIKMTGIEKGVIQWNVDVGAAKNSFKATHDQPIELNTDIRASGQFEDINKLITKSFKDRLDLIPAALNTQLATSAKFVYPGSGKLDFSTPIINGPGNVLATVSFKRLEKDAGMITVGPAEVVPLPAADTIKPPKASAAEQQKFIKPKLTWMVAPSADLPAEKKNVKFTITGTNNTSASIYFGYISAFFSSGTVGGNLFANDQINEKWNTEIQDELKQTEEAKKATSVTTEPAPAAVSQTKDNTAQSGSTMNNPIVQAGGTTTSTTIGAASASVPAAPAQATSTKNTVTTSTTSSQVVVDSAPEKQKSFLRKIVDHLPDPLNVIKSTSQTDGAVPPGATANAPPKQNLPSAPQPLPSINRMEVFAKKFVLPPNRPMGTRPTMPHKTENQVVNPPNLPPTDPISDVVMVPKPDSVDVGELIPNPPAVTENPSGPAVLPILQNPPAVDPLAPVPTPGDNVNKEPGSGSTDPQQNKPAPATDPINNDTTQKPVEEPKEVEVKKNIFVSASSTDTKIRTDSLALFGPGKTNDGEVIWWVIVQPDEYNDDDDSFFVPPGSSVSINFDMDTGKATNSDGFQIKEAWRDPADPKETFPPDSDQSWNDYWQLPINLLRS